MRSADARQSTLFSMVLTEDRVPRTHPLREIREAAAAVVAGMRWKLDAAYPPGGKTVAAPEEVLRALLLWGLYGIPSERRLMEELDYNLLYRWFVGLQLDDPMWSRQAFMDHRKRLAGAGLISEFMRGVLSRLPARVLGNPHFTPNRPLLEAWAGQQRWDEAGAPKAKPTAGRRRRAAAEAE